MGFEPIKDNCLNVYRYALTWIPKRSLIRHKYTMSLGSIPRVVLGLEESWGPLEHVLVHPAEVWTVAFSPDGARVVSGSYDSLVRIWNAVTGEMEDVLKGHSVSSLLS